MKKKVIRCFLFLVITGVFGHYIYSYSELLYAVRGVNPYSMTILAAVAFLFLLSGSLILRTILSSFNVHLPVSECFGISSLTAMVNYWTSFGGGTIGKAVYLKKKYNFSYPAFLASMSATQIIDLLWVALLGGAMVIMTGGISEPWGQSLFTGFLLLGIIIFGLIASPVRLEMPDGNVFKILRNVIESWKVIKNERWLIVKISLLLLAIHLLAAFELLVGYSAFSIKIGITQALLLGVISTLSMIVRFTPANLGIYEVVLAFSSHVLGIGFNEGLFAAGLLRVVSVFVIFSIGGICSLQLINQIKEK